MQNGIVLIVIIGGQGEFCSSIRWIIFVWIGLGFVLGLFCLIFGRLSFPLSLSPVLSLTSSPQMF